MIAVLSLIPSMRLIWLVALGAPLWPLALFIPGAWLVGLFYLVLLAALCWRDARTIPRPSELAARRELPPRFALGVDHSVKLVLRNGTALPVVAVVRDELPDSFESGADLPPVRIPSYGEAHLNYILRPLKRGAHPFGAVVLRVQGERGLMQQQMALTVGDTAKVYPNFHGADQYQLLAKIDQREEIARKPRPFKAAGTDFESLRPYISGEDPRSVDWKATARRGSLISRNKQVEKGQQLAVLLDAGRLASAGLVHNLARAAERHLVLCVVLTEPLIVAIARSVPTTVEDTYRKAAACDQLRRRGLALENMRSRGILVLETDPAHLSIHLVKRYLEIRQADLQ